MIARPRIGPWCWIGVAAMIALAGCGSAAQPSPDASAPSAASPVATTQAFATIAPSPTSVPVAQNLAPDIAIPAAKDWYNSPPLTLAGLRGKPVFLVFWSDI